MQLLVYPGDLKISASRFRGNSLGNGHCYEILYLSSDPVAVSVREDPDSDIQITDTDLDRC